MEITFIVRYRRALRELQDAYRLQYALIDESDALRTLAYQQEQASEKAILKNRKSGRGFLISRLRECLEEEPHAWAVTQQLKRQIEEMEEGGYDSVVDNEQNHALYLVIEDAISVLLDVLGNQFPKVLTDSSIVTYRGNVPVSELVLKFGPTHLQRIVRQRLKAEADNPAPATTEPPQPGSLVLDTPVPTVADLCRAPFTPADLNRLLASLNVLTETFTLAGPTYCLSGSLIKKGAVRISKTFAALTELNENGLLNWVGWQAAMKAPPYGLTFGEKVRAYEYKSKNARRRSDTFDTAIENTRRWLNRWRTAYNSQKQP